MAEEETCACGGNCGKVTQADIEHGIEVGSRRHGWFKKAYYVIGVTLPFTMFMWQGIWASLFVMGLMALYFIEANATALAKQVGILRQALQQVAAKTQLVNRLTNSDDDSGEGQYL